MNTPHHPTDEQLSAALDGHDPGASAHAEACEACQERLALLQQVADALAVSPPVDELARERAIAAALDIPMAEDESIVFAPRRRRPRRWSPMLGVGVAAVAALIVAVFVVPSLVGGGNNGGQTASKASKAGQALDSAQAGVVDGGDLGAMSDSQALAGIVGSAIGANFSATGSAAAGAQNGRAQSTTTAPAAPAAPAMLAPASRPLLAGPVPCADAVAKDYSRGLGPLLYTATLSWQGKPAVVLAYEVSPPTDKLGHRVFVLARSTCTLLTVLSI